VSGGIPVYSIILLEVGNYYLTLDDDIVEHGLTADNVENILLISKDKFNAFTSGDVYSGNTVKQIICGANVSTDYMYIKSHNSISFVLHVPSFRKGIMALLDSTSNDQALQIETMLRMVNEFRINNRDALAESIFIKNNVGLDDVISAFKIYTLSDKYSFWLYNPDTNIFTLEASSEISENIYVDEESNTSLYDFKNSGKMFESRKPVNDKLFCEVYSDMKTINRIYIDFKTDNVIGILSFYSKYENMGLKEKTVQYIRQILHTKFSEHIAELHEELIDVNYIFTANNEVKTVNSLCDQLTLSICKHLKFEACSIFVLDESDRLVLLSTNDITFNGRPNKEIAYNLTTKSHTCSVFNNKQDQACYDLSISTYNSHIYDEVTECPSTNWIGICLKDGDTPIGVLRVKNKYTIDTNNQKKVSTFGPNDIVRLRIIGKNLTARLMLERLMNDANDRAKAIEKRYEELTDFNDLFLHELRTPISNFILAPSYVIKQMNKLLPQSDKKQKLINMINDIKLLGYRLKHIVSIHNIGELIETCHITELNVLRDIVYPVYNISQSNSYKGGTIQLEHKSLESVQVYADMTLTNIAFNALVDNARKYSIDKSTPINIYGKYDRTSSYYLLCVENYGIDIDIDEVSDIFGHRFRGHTARSKALAGTGMGLFITKEIMLKTGGDVVLLSNTNPVIFCLKLPVVFH